MLNCQVCFILVLAFVHFVKCFTHFYLFLVCFFISHSWFKLWHRNWMILLVSMKVEEKLTRLQKWKKEKNQCLKKSTGGMILVIQPCWTINICTLSKIVNRCAWYMIVYSWLYICTFRSGCRRSCAVLLRVETILQMVLWNYKHKIKGKLEDCQYFQC